MHNFIRTSPAPAGVHRRASACRLISRPSPAVPANEDKGTLKRLFVAALLRQPHKVHEAAKRVFPGSHNTARAMHATQHWPTDPTSSP